MQVLVAETRCPHEDNLKFLAFGNDLRVRADFTHGILLSWLSELVELVNSSGDRITSSELISVDRIPVEEEVLDGATVFSQIAGEELHL